MWYPYWCKAVSLVGENSQIHWYVIGSFLVSSGIISAKVGKWTINNWETMDNDGDTDSISPTEILQLEIYNKRQKTCKINKNY